MFATQIITALIVLVTFLTAQTSFAAAEKGNTEFISTKGSDNFSNDTYLINTNQKIDDQDKAEENEGSEKTGEMDSKENEGNNDIPSKWFPDTGNQIEPEERNVKNPDNSIPDTGIPGSGPTTPTPTTTTGSSDPLLCNDLPPPTATGIDLSFGTICFSRNINIGGSPATEYLMISGSIRNNSESVRVPLNTGIHIGIENKSSYYPLYPDTRDQSHQICLATKLLNSAGMAEQWGIGIYQMLGSDYAITNQNYPASMVRHIPPLTITLDPENEIGENTRNNTIHCTSFREFIPGEGSPCLATSQEDFNRLHNNGYEGECPILTNLLREYTPPAPPPPRYDNYGGGTTPPPTTYDPYGGGSR